jgi:hypothetical protein
VNCDFFTFIGVSPLSEFSVDSCLIFKLRDMYKSETSRKLPVYVINEKKTGRIISVNSTYFVWLFHGNTRQCNLNNTAPSIGTFAGRVNAATSGRVI